ncbi:MAG: BspA family leucine-rich repeat surface protein, partial [Flavobacteriaceae bacterium]|nr:BspA family leucine-rich repeat surface protein [Flavobacteriaceae bacterium]
MAGPTTPNPTNFRVSSYYTGRFNGDANGVMTASEEIIAAGNANIPGLRYGDYSKIDIDPSDDLMFWFINEYMNNGRRGVVGAFQLEALTPIANAGDDSSICFGDCSVIGESGNSNLYTYSWTSSPLDINFDNDIPNPIICPAESTTYTVTVTEISTGITDQDSVNINVTFINDDNIQVAVDLWISDPTTAEATYGNISNWDTSCVTDMSGLFQGYTTFNDDISQWDTSNVTSMASMFRGADSFNQDIGDWDVSNVIYIREMFSSADSFNQPISDWNVSGITDMYRMFFDARDFNNPIENWDVSNVTNMFAMFQAAEDFDQDIGGWDVSNVTDMRYMLDGADSFNQDIGDWNVANVTDFEALLNNTMSFNQYIGSWDVSSVINMNLIFNNSGISTANYDAILQGWAAQTVQNNVILGAGGLFYCNAEAERQSLIDNFGWTFGGDAIDPNCSDAVINCGDYVIEPFCAGDQSLIFPNCNNTEPTCNATAEAGPDYGCLFSQPYPSWFYLQIDDPGDLDFEIVQNTAFDGNGNPTGTGLDVDFIAWGPFAEGDNLCDPSLLQPFNEAGCSYSAAPIENVTIPNAQTGELYVLLITNYNQSAGFIKLAQTNTGDPGAGSTNCEIITTCSIEIDGGDDQNLCNVTETTLTTTTSGAIESYQWYLNENEIVGATSNILTVSEPGIYKVIADGTDCEPAQDQVLIEIPQVDAGEDLLVCQQENCVTLTGAIAPSIEVFLWSSSGTGFFDDPNTLNPTYCFSVLDYNTGSVVLTLEGVSYTDDDCLVQDSLIISIGNTIDYTEIPVYEQYDDLVLDGITAFYLESQSS